MDNDCSGDAFAEVLRTTLVWAVMARNLVETVDCVVVGTGVVGLAVARVLALRGREVWTRKMVWQNRVSLPLCHDANNCLCRQFSEYVKYSPVQPDGN